MSLTFELGGCRVCGGDDQALGRREIVRLRLRSLVQVGMSEAIKEGGKSLTTLMQRR